MTRPLVFRAVVLSTALLGLAPVQAGDLTRVPVSMVTGLPQIITGLGVLGSSQANPYAGPYPSYLQGIGGIGYYDVKPLANSALRLPSGSVIITNPLTYGSLDPAMGLTVSANSNRPGCVAGYTAPGQVSAYDEFGGSALCSQIDTVPYMALAAGSFTAATFVPTTPIALSSSVTIGVGMWLRSTDATPYEGQVTSWSTATQTGLTSAAATVGPVTGITVSGWFQRGNGGTAGTPSASSAYLNPQDKVWNQLNVTFLDGISATGTTTAGSSQVTGLSTTLGVVPNRTLMSGGGLTGTVVVTGVSGSTVYVSAPATASGSQTLLYSLGTDVNKGVGMEMDVQNAGPPFVPTWISDTGSWVASDYTVTGLVLTSQWRPGVMITGAGIGAYGINYVESVNYGNNSLQLRYKTSVAGSSIVIKGKNQFDEGGTGIDCLGVVNNSNTCFLQRGSMSYGYVSMGAGDTSFLVRPEVLAGLPLYGFRVDGRDNGFPSQAAFAVTSNNVKLWWADGSGGHHATSYAVGSTAGVSCSGAPTASYQVTNGIVTHC